MDTRRKKKKGRLKPTRRRTVEYEIKERGYTLGTVKRKKKEEWRKLVLVLCVIRHSKVLVSNAAFFL